MKGGTYTMTNKLTITVKEMSEMLGISIPKAYDLVKSEGFPSIQLGRRIVVPFEPFKQWIEEQAQKPKKYDY